GRSGDTAGAGCRDVAGGRDSEAATGPGRALPGNHGSHPDPGEHTGERSQPRRRQNQASGDLLPPAAGQSGRIRLTAEQARCRFANVDARAASVPRQAAAHLAQRRAGGNRFRRQGRYLADSRADLSPTVFPVVKLRRAQRIARTDPGYLISPSACIAALTAGRAATRSWKLCRFANLARSTLTTLA